MRSLFRQFWDNSAILLNASSIVGTVGVTSLLGFAYWWLAARLFVPADVGFASATVSAMLLLGEIGIFGLGTLLLGELPRQPENAGPLISAAVTLAGGIACGLGVLFAVAAPMLSSDLQSLADGLPNIAAFTLGVMFTTMGMVIDQALVGLLRGGVQLIRNVIVAVAKLAALFLMGLWMASQTGMTIYNSWTIGVLTSLLGLAAYLWWPTRQLPIHRPDWRLMRGLRRSVLEHHALNLALLGPGKALPILVTALLSAEVNAGFFIAWMIASLVYEVPRSLTTMLFTVGAKDPAGLAQKTRFTLQLSLLAGVLASAFLIIFGEPLLGLFGTTYAEQAGQGLRLLTLGVFPVTVKFHYIAINRVHNRLAVAAGIMAVGAIIELILATLGASVGGLLGLCVGWVAAVCIEAMVTVPAVLRTVAASRGAESAA